jgi:hypothetical protein
VNTEPKTAEVALPQHTTSSGTAPARRIPAGGPTPAPRAAPLYLGAWLAEHGAPANSKEVVDNERTSCERVLQVGRPAEEAIQCDVVIDSSGGLEQDGHECETPECVHASMSRTRIFVLRESKIRTVLDVPSSVLLSSSGGSGGGIAGYIQALVAVGDDGLHADVTLDGDCGMARDAVREDMRETSIRSALKRFIAGAVDQVCVAQGRYTWSGGKFRR